MIAPKHRPGPPMTLGNMRDLGRNEVPQKTESTKMVAASSRWGALRWHCGWIS